MKIGQTILAGFTYYDKDGKITEQEQLFGEITEIDQESIKVKYTNGEEWFIPAYALDAPRGGYECISSGEKVTNPDLIVSWMIKDSADPNSPPKWRLNYAPLVMSDVPKEFDYEYTYDYEREAVESLIDAKREEYLGKVVMIGLTYHKQVDGEDEVVERKQVHGRIVRISYGEGIVFKLDDGTEFTLPPVLQLLQPASPGEYTEHSTGKVIVDPDFVTMWSVFLPEKEGEAIPE